MPTTPLQALPYPSLSDPANGPLGFQNLAEALESKLVMVFADTAARDAAIASPTSGMTVWLSTPKRLEFYNGTAWQRVLASPSLIQSGSFSVSLTSDVQGSTAVVFPTAFTAAPLVVATAFSHSTYLVTALSITATGFSGFVRQIDGTALTTNVEANWIAMLP